MAKQTKRRITKSRSIHWPLKPNKRKLPPVTLLFGLSVTAILTISVLAMSNLNLLKLISQVNTKASFTGVTISVQPQSVSVQPGQAFTVRTYVNTNGLSMSGTDLVITYDPAMIKATALAVANSNFLSVAGTSPSPDILVPPNISTPGRMTVSLGTGPTAAGVSGTGAIATLYFTAKQSTGQTTIIIDPATFVGAIGHGDSNMAGALQNATVSIAYPTQVPTATAAPAPSSTPITQTSCSQFQKSSMSTTVMTAGSSIKIYCDFGIKNLDCIRPYYMDSTTTTYAYPCFLTGWRGSAAIFSCRAPLYKGSYKNLCGLIAGTSNNCVPGYCSNTPFTVK